MTHPRDASSTAERCKPSSPRGSSRWPTPPLVLSLGVVLLVCLAADCTKESAVAQNASASEALPFGPAECGACGMVVREQPAPRGQVIRRDGTREYFCSVGDMVQHLASPSPHGRARSVFVETLPPDIQLPGHATHPHLWREAKQSHFVLGVERAGIMGPPVLVFATHLEADAASKRFSGRTSSWSALSAAVLQAAQKPHVP